MILLAEHDEPSLAAKKKQRHVALETATSTPKNRVWGFENYPPGQISCEPDLSAETATGSVQFSYENASGQTNYYTRDHQGSVRELMSSTGTIVSRMAYDPYGRVTTVSGTTLPTKQYTGDYYHPTSGLNLTWRRAYDSNTGRWLSRDPITERGGLNLYSYVSDDPENGMDSTGLCGHFDINIGSITGTGGVNAVAIDVPGYNLHFKDEGCCPNGKIKLVQALAVEGWLTHQAPSLDSTNADSKANATTPGGTPLPDASSSPGEIDDAPGSVPDWGATVDLEVCAVCVCNGKENVIGCVAFKWKNSNHKLNYQGKDVNSISADPVPPGSLYNAGVDDWHSRAGKGL